MVKSLNSVTPPTTPITCQGLSNEVAREGADADQHKSVPTISHTSHGLCDAVIAHDEVIPRDRLALGEVLHGVGDLILARGVNLRGDTRGQGESEFLMNETLSRLPGRGGQGDHRRVGTEDELLMISGTTSSRVTKPFPSLSYLLNSAVSAADICGGLDQYAAHPRPRLGAHSTTARSCSDCRHRFPTFNIAGSPGYASYLLWEC